MKKGGKKKRELKRLFLLCLFTIWLEGERAGNERTGDCCTLLYCDSASRVTCLQEEMMFGFIKKVKLKGRMKGEVKTP